MFDFDPPLNDIPTLKSPEIFNPEPIAYEVLPERLLLVPSAKEFGPVFVTVFVRPKTKAFTPSTELLVPKVYEPEPDDVTVLDLPIIVLFAAFEVLLYPNIAILPVEETTPILLD